MYIKDNIKGEIKLETPPANLYAQQMINAELDSLKAKLESNRKLFPDMRKRSNQGTLNAAKNRMIEAVESVNKDIIQRIRNLTLTLNTL